MNVWVRIVGVLEVDSNESRESATQVAVKSGLDLTVYRTKERAEAAQAKSGGIVLEVDAKGLSELNNEFGDEVLIVREHEIPEAPDRSTTVVVTIAAKGELEPNFGPFEPGTVEPQGDILKFDSDEEAWLEEFAELTEFRLHQ